MKPKNSRTENVIALVRSMKPYSFEMLLTIICAFFKHMSTIGAAALTSYMVGLSMQNRLADKFHALLPLLIACILIRAAFYYGEMWFGHDVAFRVLRDFRIKLFKQVEKISPAYSAKSHTAGLGQALVGDVEVLELFLAHTFGAFIVAIIVTVILLGAIAVISPVLSLLMFVFSVTVGVVPYIMKKKADKQGYDVRNKLARANIVTLEGIQGLKELLTLNSIERYKSKNRDRMAELYKAQFIYGKRQGLESMLTQALLGSFTVFVMAIAAKLVASGVIDFSVYPVAVMLSAMLFSPIIEVTNVAQSLGLVFASANRIQDVLNEPPAVADCGNTAVMPNKFNVSFEGVHFSYTANKPEHEPEVLKGISFNIEEGTSVALVGHSGAGKTTCANLLLRYWDAECGMVKIGGTNIKNIAMKDLRDLVTAVPQDTYLFHTTVKDNIKLGKKQATDTEVMNAAASAYADEFILNLPKGYNTVTGEKGFQLSGGQRQRISIARAVLKDAPVIVMDEAVSSLDTENELYIQKALKSRLKGKTMLIIAHRLSTIMAADKIIVLDKGEVVQQGTHRELIAQEGPYKRLMETQLCKPN